MTRMDEAEEYLAKKAQETGLVVVSRVHPTNMDALVMTVGEPSRGAVAIVSVSGVELIDAHASLLDCRLEQARTMLASLNG